MAPVAIREQEISMDELLKDSVPFAAPKPGDMIEGRVIAKGRNHILIDINGVATGIISGKELLDSADTAKSLGVGDSVFAFVLEDENEDGMIVLSLRKAAHLKVWDKLRRLYAEGGTVEVVAKEANKGGLMTEIDGVRAFLPVSQLAPTNFPRVDGANAEVILKRLQELVGRKFQCKVIMLDENIPKIMVSEREAYGEIRSQELAKLKKGDVVDGEINGIVKFGVFVTFGNLEGLVHVSEITWSDEARNPQKEYKMGQKVQAKVIGFDNEKISLSIKRLERDPWQEKIAQFKVGDIKKGKVNKVTDFGIFVTLAEEITGLVHITEFENDKKSPQDLFKEDDQVEVKILEINDDDRSLKLSLKTGNKDKKPQEQSSDQSDEANEESTKEEKEEAAEEKSTE
jgi:small subunit ribosomal protein S1